MKQINIDKTETSQTAVSWLIEEIHKNMGVWIPPHIQDQAKQMEKEQICNAFDKGWKDEMRIGEEYYNETYGNNNSN